MDLDRQRGADVFEAAVVSLSAQADEADAIWTRYEEACRGQSTGGSVRRGRRGWIISQVFIDNETTPECLGWRSDIERLSIAVQRGLHQADENARRSGVFPGTRRQIRSRYGLNWAQ